MIVRKAGLFPIASTDTRVCPAFVTITSRNSACAPPAHLHLIILAAWVGPFFNQPLDPKLSDYTHLNRAWDLDIQSTLLLTS